LAALTLAIGPIATPSAHAEIVPAAIPDFNITGAGNGHGIGLSQYGAQGYALSGWTYDAIVKHYYQGTSVAAMANTVQPRVNLSASGGTRATWTVRAIDATLTVRSALDSNVKVTLAKNTYFTISNTSGGVVVKDAGGVTKATFASGNVIADPDGGALIEIKDASGPMSYPYVRWRGYLEFARSGTTALYVYNVVSFQEYLYGVVPRESPASWDPDALKAQAVVARSYAKKKLDPNDDGARDATLMCTTADQVYGGNSKLVQGEVDPHEDSRTNAAVSDTNNLIVKYQGTIVQTFFSSASGGHTANIEDSWSYSSPQPYYTGVDDPYEALAGSPYESWTVKLSGLDIATKLRGSSTASSELSSHGLPAVPGGSSIWVTGVTITRGTSGYPRWVYFHFNDPAKTVCKLSAYTVKVALGLKSPNFAFSGFPMSRIQGATRYDTAVAISKKAFTGTAPAVVMASGEDYPDALTGSALAGAASGALLLTGKSSLPDVIKTELKRLNPSQIYVMGSAAAISETVATAIKAAVPAATVTRVEGVDRYETARKAADRVFALKAPTKAIVVNGTAWPDAASVSALAYAKSYPILLAKPSELGTQTAEYLSARKPATTYVIGSETVVPKAVYDAIPAATGNTALRLSGPNRYATAAAVARQSITLTEGFSATEVYITTGLNYPDALVGGVLAGKTKHPLLLTGFDSCPADTASFLTGNKSVISYIWILGGGGAISKEGAGAIDSVMMN